MLLQITLEKRVVDALVYPWGMQLALSPPKVSHSSFLLWTKRVKARVNQSIIGYSALAVQIPGWDCREMGTPRSRARLCRRSSSQRWWWRRTRSHMRPCVWPTKRLGSFMVNCLNVSVNARFLHPLVNLIILSVWGCGRFLFCPITWIS